MLSKVVAHGIQEFVDANVVMVLTCQIVAPRLMVAKYFIILVIIFISGCSPYTSQYRSLNQAYKNGQLTYPEYVQDFQNVQMQDMIWRQNMANSFSAIGQSASQYSYQSGPTNFITTNRSTYTHCQTNGNQTNCYTN